MKSFLRTLFAASLLVFVAAPSACDSDAPLPPICEHVPGAC